MKNEKHPENETCEYCTFNSTSHAACANEVLDVVTHCSAAALHCARSLVHNASALFEANSTCEIMLEASDISEAKKLASACRAYIALFEAAEKNNFKAAEEKRFGGAAIPECTCATCSPKAAE